MLEDALILTTLAALFVGSLMILHKLSTMFSQEEE